MGNVHEVIQTEPWYSTHGAVLRIRENSSIEPTHFPSYTNITRGTRIIGRSVFYTNQMFLLVNTGGKWGYGDDLQQFIAEHAQALEDARFYISDEYSEYVQEWRISGGTLTVSRVAQKDSHPGLYLLENYPEHQEFALMLIEDSLEIWLRISIGEDEPDPASAYERMVTALVTHRSKHWFTWFQHGVLNLTHGLCENAFADFERALPQTPAAKRSLVEVGMFLAQCEFDPVAALAFGRRCLTTWIPDALAERKRYEFEISWGIERLAKLEQTHGSAQRSLQTHLEYVRVSNSEGVAQRLYLIGCLRATEGRPSEARDWLRAAFLIDPSLAECAATEKYLAAVGDLAPLVDPNHDAS